MIRALALTVAMALPAHAQSQCSPLTDVLAGLLRNYQETVRATALMANGSILVITTAPSGGWTAIIASPEGQACLAASGENFEAVEQEPPGIDG